MVRDEHMMRRSPALYQLSRRRTSDDQLPLRFKLPSATADVRAMTDPAPQVETHLVHVKDVPLVDAATLRRHALEVNHVDRVVGATRRRYRMRSIASIVFGVMWLALSIFVAVPWLTDLSDDIGLVLALVVIAGIAWIPGYLYAQLLASVLLDHRPPLRAVDSLPDLTVIVAVYNERDALEPTVDALVASDYPGELHVVIVDDGSTDDTLDVASRLAAAHTNVTACSAPHGGKHSALNAALARVTTPIVSTVDADTIVHPTALRRIVTRLAQTTDCVAVAGSLLAGNDDESLIARMQGWEYRLSIAALKRQQAMFGATLVAQGAFSVYATRPVLEAGGWPDAIGEDILVTWRLIDAGGLVINEPTAFAYTDVPTTARDLYRQRRRWARGMFEGLAEHGGSLVSSRRLVSHNVLVDYALPVVDFAYVFAFVPGLVLAMFGYTAIVAPITFLVMPLALLLFAIIARSCRHARRSADIELTRHWSGFFAYMTFYRALIGAASLAGYWRYVRRRRREW